MFTADDVVKVETDLLLHYANNVQNLTSPQKLLQQTSHLLEVASQKEVSPFKRNFAAFVACIARLESEQVPYEEVKRQFKVLFLRLVGSESEVGLLKMVLHNLATINYI